MAFILKDRVKENSTTTGTGNISLGGASATFDTFQSYLTNGDTTYYAIAHTSSGVDEWEVGLGTWNTGNTLSRTTVLAGSNGTSAVDFSAGTKDIFMTYPASKAAVVGEDVTFADITVTGTVDGRDVAADGVKLDGIDTSADVTDAVTVAAAGALMRSGGTMTGNLILNADPNAALGAATKQYVDTIASAGIHYHAPVRAEHPSNLNATYNNGSSGVGATLTNAGTNAALVIDSVSMVLNDRVLVANQTDQTQNGVYTVTTVGDGSTAWVLTRSTDTDTAAPSDPDAFGKGDAFFIKEGFTNAGHLDVLSTSGTIVFGTTNIVFSEVAETTVYSGGTGITLTGTTFSIGQDVGTTSNVTFNQVTAAIIGNVTGNLTGDVTGNADTATALETARTIQLSGDVTGSASFDGTANINITAAVQDDSHAHVISNVDGLQSALDAKVPTSRIITAGNGLTGGGDLSANRTLTVGAGGGITVTADTVAHADTSSQASVNNSMPNVIQDITLDTYGHVTNIASANLDDRYYTESEADSRFVNVTGDTITGTLTLGSNPSNAGELLVNDTSTTAYTVAFKGTGTRGYAFEGSASSADYNTTFSNAGTGDHNVNINGHLGIGGTATDANWADATHGNTEVAIDGGGGYGVLHFRGDGAGTTNTRYSIGVGDSIFYMAYDDVDGVHRAKIDSSHRLIVNEGSGDQRVFHDTYHPNADKWTTARTLSLSGDASGSVSWDGSANATLSVAVSNDSHTHDGRYFTETESDGRFVRKGVGYIWTATGPNALSFRSQNTIDTATGDQAALEIYQDNAGEDAFIQFHVAGDYGKYLGLHGGINDFVVGGWSHGASYQRLFHDGYHPNADTLTTARTINGVSFNGSANITIADSTKLPLSGGTMTGELQLNARLDVGSGTQADAEIRIYKSDNNVSDHIQFYNGTTRIGEIGCQDTTWLRINQVTAKNIYTPRYIRADGGFFVDGTAKGINGSGNFIGGTIAGASDYNTLIRSNGDDDVSGHTEWQDNYTIRLGTGADFRMWFDGTNAIFRNYAHSGGDIYFQGEDTAGVNHALLYMYTNNTAPFLILHQDGAERLRTVGGGCAVTGLMVGAVASPQNTNGLQVSMTNDQKIVLSGSSNPYIRFQENTTDRAYIQYVASQDALLFRNQETDNFDFMPDASTGAVNLRLRGSDNDTWGSLYGADNGSYNQIGLLDGDQAWAYRITNDTSHEWLINNVVEMSLNTATLDMKGNTITEVEDIGLRDIIYHDGDTDTYMQFATNEIRLVSGGSQEVTINTTGVRLGDTGNGYFQPVSGNYGSIQIDGGGHGGYEGYSIGGRAVFMHNNSTSTGIYNDVNNHWLFYGVHTSYTRMYFNGASKVETTSTGVTVNGNVNSTSDIRYKKNIKTIEGAVDKVTALRGVTFDWDNEAFPEDESTKKPNFTERATGVIAQDVEKVLPEAVTENPETGFKNVSYGNMVGLLIEAIKEQQTQINDLKAEIQSMKS